MADTEKLVFMVLHGPEHPEHATIPFVMGCAALASDVEVVLGFQADGVELVHVGVADGIHAAGFPPLASCSRTSVSSAGLCSSAGPASTAAGSPRRTSSMAPRSSPPVALSPRSPRQPTASSTRETDIMPATPLRPSSKPSPPPRSSTPADRPVRARSSRPRRASAPCRWVRSSKSGRAIPSPRPTSARGPRRSATSSSASSRVRATSASSCAAASSRTRAAFRLGRNAAVDRRCPAGRRRS